MPLNLHMKNLLLLIILLISTVAFGQITKDQLVGSWQCYHLELENGDTGEELTFDGKPYTCDVIIDLRSNMTGIESSGGIDFQYALQDSILMLGNRYYKIESLTKSELILLDKPSPNPFSLANYRQKFNKINERQ